MEVLLVSHLFCVEFLFICEQTGGTLRSLTMHILAGLYFANLGDVVLKHKDCSCPPKAVIQNCNHANQFSIVESYKSQADLMGNLKMHAENKALRPSLHGT